MWLFKRKKTVTPPESPPEPHPMTISDEVVAEAGQKPQREFVRYEPPPGVIPEDIRNAVLAMDSTPYDTLNSQYPDFVYGGLRMQKPRSKPESPLILYCRICFRLQPVRVSVLI